MFQTKETKCVGFDSKWKLKKVSIEGSSQTTEYSTQEKSSESVATSEIEVQTDADEPKTADYDEERLAEWLRKIYPAVKRELDDVSSSQAFKNYRPYAENAEATMKLLKIVKLEREGGDSGVPVSALTWNMTGNTLAVACNRVHETWCHHNGLVSLYTFDRDDLLPDLPQKKLYAQSCVTCLKYHPNLAPILVGGTYSGEIIVWDTHTDDDGSILLRINGHEETVSQVSWINDVDVSRTVLLASSSLDGFLCLWNFVAKSKLLSMKEKYKIKAPLFGRMARKTDLSPSLQKKVDRGIIGFDFSKSVPERFVVAAEGGLVAQCSMLGARPLPESTKEIPISDPIYKYYAPHEGEITSITFSPNRKELFLTNGSEGEIRIYTIDQEGPVQVMHLENPVQQISWVPYQEQLLAACGLKGFVEVFNVLKGKPVSNTLNEFVEPSVLTQLDINMKRLSMVATGNQNGDLLLWSIPWNLLFKKM